MSAGTGTEGNGGEGKSAREARGNRQQVVTRLHGEVAVANMQHVNVRGGKGDFVNLLHRKNTSHCVQTHGPVGTNE